MIPFLLPVSASFKNSEHKNHHYQKVNFHHSCKKSIQYFEKVLPLYVTLFI
jgi:hypothetical protein